MSINLRVEDYCNDCPYFEAEVEHLTHLPFMDGDCATHFIYCQHRHKCNHIKEHLEEKAST
jgi:hypothetical protein